MRVTTLNEVRSIGHIHALWRYPVKSMAGQLLSRATLTAAGMAGDRLYAFESASPPPGQLRVSATERRTLLSLQATVDPDHITRVHLPGGESLPVTSSALKLHLERTLNTTVTLTHESTPQTDVRPLSLLSLATVAALSAELQQPLDPQRLRANLLCSLDAGAFAEDALFGRSLQIGAQARILIRERTPRCRFITYDPAASLLADPLFTLMKHLDRHHQGRAGVYAQTVTPGEIAADDTIYLVD